MSDAPPPAGTGWCSHCHAIVHHDARGGAEAHDEHTRPGVPCVLGTGRPVFGTFPGGTSPSERPSLLPVGVTPLLSIEASGDETVRITLMWTGDPQHLDDALAVLRMRMERSRELVYLAVARLNMRPEAAERATALACQLVDGALGEEGELDEEPHEHLAVTRHARGGTTR